MTLRSPNPGAGQSGVHLIVAAFWTEAVSPDSATEAVAASLKGNCLPGSGSVVSISPRDQRGALGALRQFNLPEPGEWKP